MVAPPVPAPPVLVPTAAESGRGLSEAEARLRLGVYGPNELPSAERRSLARILRDVLGEPMFAFLLAAAAIYLALGSLVEAIFLAAFATFSVSIALVQEARGERALEALRDLSSPRALVIRDGERRRITGREVVPGDAVVLAEGDRVPADGLIVAAHDLLVDESLVTGESIPVEKRAAMEGETGDGRSGGDSQPHVFAGTLIARGNGIAMVRATGAASAIGRIGGALGKIEIEPPRLRRQTARLVRLFAAAGLGLSVLAVALYRLAGAAWLDSILAGIALAMSMLPEEFPLVLTVFTVMGAWRISTARVLTRRAAAIESLGAATVLCADKTGTMTENRMALAAVAAGEEIWRGQRGEAARSPALGGEAARSPALGGEAARSPALGGEAARSPALDGVVSAALLASAPHAADPMEKALFAASPEIKAAAGRTLVKQYGLRPELPVMSNVWAGDDGTLVCAKGAPETVAALCRMDGAGMARVRRQVDGLARQGMRVLGVARAAFPGGPLPESQRDFAFAWLGLVGFADPVRPSVPAAIDDCRAAGIKVVMITGDYPATAREIAAQAGLDAADVVSGEALDRLSDAELAARLATARVFARIRPEQKLRLVAALKAAGNVVAMTGDGVNDAPALKAAHIGIAMGGRGTDVAREAASIVLLDDDFGSIVRAVRLGRRIYDNLRKAFGYIMAIHVPIAGTALLPLLLGQPMILTPIHIAFLEMVIDPACSVVFEAEDEEPDVMRRPPRHPEARLLSPALVGWSLLQGAAAMAAVAAIYFVALFQGLPEDELRALAFVTLVLANIGLILVNRSFGRAPWAAFGHGNRALWALLSVVAATLAVALLWPPAQHLFRFGALHWDDCGYALLAAAAVVAALELVKPIWRAQFRA
jgi:P-type Ca2+ transporter type 2C